MKKINLLLNLQRKFKQGGYALVSKAGKLVVFGENIKKLYEKIDKQRIKDEDKIVMHIPSPRVTHAFTISLSVRILR